MRVTGRSELEPDWVNSKVYTSIQHNHLWTVMNVGLKKFKITRERLFLIALVGSTLLVVLLAPLMVKWLYTLSITPIFVLAFLVIDIISLSIYLQWLQKPIQQSEEVGLMDRAICRIDQQIRHSK
jgi:hypothetical protein